MTRIAIFIPSLRGGGVERIMLNLSQGLILRGYAVDLVVAQAGGAYLDQIPSGVRLVDLHASRVLLALPGLTCYLRKEQPMALLCGMDHANLVGLWARSLAGVKTRVVASVHTSVQSSRRAAKGYKRKLLPILMRWYYRHAEAVVAVSAGVGNEVAQIAGLEPGRIRTLYNPVVTPQLLDRAAESVDHPWFRPGEPPVVLAAGHLTKPKDFPTLLKAFTLVAQQSDSRLMILGEGKDRPHLEALVAQLGIADRVSMPGFVPNPYKYMARARIFVLSSSWEGLPSVLVEALAVGTPVASTDCPHGPREILDNGRYGKLVPVGDANQLAQAILSTMQSPVDPSILQQRAQEFSLERVLDQYLEVLHGRD